MLLVNVRLPFISVDLWYRRLPNNTAVLTVGTKTVSVCLATVDRLRLTTINRDRTRPNKTIIYRICLLTMNAKYAFFTDLKKR